MPVIAKTEFSLALKKTAVYLGTIADNNRNGLTIFAARETLK